MITLSRRWPEGNHGGRNGCGHATIPFCSMLELNEPEDLNEMPEHPIKHVDNLTIAEPVQTSSRGVLLACVSHTK